MDLNKARKNLEACLSEDLRKEYFTLLRQWLLFTSPMTKEEFDKAVRKLFVNDDQIQYHNYFMLAILSKKSSNSRPKPIRIADEKGVFEHAEYSDYVNVSSPSMIPSGDHEYRSAAAELFIPDSGFIASKIAIIAGENGMDGAEDNVTELIVYACQVFVKNIITAMITRKKGYKVRDGKFQYGFNQPIANPFIRNFNNVLDNSLESKVEIENEDDCFKPKCKLSLENMEQQLAFSYSCSNKKLSDNNLDVKLLYDTIRENPSILGLHSIHSVNVFKLGLQVDEDIE